MGVGVRQYRCRQWNWGTLGWQTRPGEGVSLLGVGPLRDAVSCAPSKASSSGVADVNEGQLQCNFDDARIRVPRTSVDASVSRLRLSKCQNTMSSRTHACCQQRHRQPGQRRNRGPSAAASLQVGCRSEGARLAVGSVDSKPTMSTANDGQHWVLVMSEPRCPSRRPGPDLRALTLPVSYVRRVQPVCPQAGG
jgi:hypothetical protein